MAACLELLTGSIEPDVDRAAFALAQLAFWLLAATDGHAKNFSVFLYRGDKYGMTPLYHIISAWPYIGNAPNRFRWRSSGLAMAMRAKNVHYAFHTIHTRHWHQLAMKNGGSMVWNSMLDMVQRVEPALARVEGLLPQGFPERTWLTIAAGMRTQAKVFEAGLSPSFPAATAR